MGSIFKSRPMTLLYGPAQLSQRTPRGTTLAPSEVGRATISPYDPSLVPGAPQQTQQQKRTTILGRQYGAPNLDSYSGKTLG
jgi:hypothetical protein